MELEHLISSAKREHPVALGTRVLNWLHTRWLQMTYPFAAMGEKVSIDYRCPLSRLHAHRISIGSGVILAKGAYLGIGLSTRGRGEPIIVIEDNCVVHCRSQIGGKNHIHIERDTVISQNVLIADNDHDYQDVSKPIDRDRHTTSGTIRIGEGSRIGHGAAIICSQGELVLGRHCVVTANAIVTKSAPPFSVLSGNPAKVIKQYDPVKKKWVLGSVRAGKAQGAIDSNHLL